MPFAKYNVDAAHIEAMRSAGVVTRMRTNHPRELEQAVAQLREALAADKRLGQSMEYLVQLQVAIEAAGRAVRDARWARDGYVFQGE
jgi:hypothetical protein